MSDLIAVHIKIRRYDVGENPLIQENTLHLNPRMDYVELKRALKQFLNVASQEDKVIKVRNKNHTLVPLTFLLEGAPPGSPFIIDVVKTNKNNTARTNVHLQDAYLDAVRQKVDSLASRITQAEMLIPQLQWNRQTHMEETVQNLSTRMSFLNRRIDELTPAQWKSKCSIVVS